MRGRLTQYGNRVHAIEHRVIGRAVETNIALCGVFCTGAEVEFDSASPDACKQCATRRRAREIEVAAKLPEVPE